MYVSFQWQENESVQISTYPTHPPTHHMGETAGYRVEHAHTYSPSEKLQLVELFEYFDGTVLGRIRTS